MKYGLGSLASLILAASPAIAAEVTNFTLDNGLDVVVLEDHRAPAVTHMVWYRVGAADEPAGVSGIAHFLEHLMFKATDELASGELSETVALNGGSDNAFTSHDYTAYFQRVAADRLDLMMKMEASRMDGLALVADDIATERAVVIEERNLRTENDPAALFNEQRRAVQYLHHPYQTPVIGWRHEAETLTLEDAKTFYQAHYAPNNAILIVAGDVEPDEVRAMAEKHYGVIPANPAITPRERVEEPPQLAERRVIYDDPRIGQPYIIRTYLAPERDPGAQEEAAALVLLSEILGGSGTSSVLAKKLQFDSEVAIYASAFYSPVSLDDTTFGVAVIPADGNTLAETEVALDTALAEFMEEGVDPEQLDRIKMQLRADRIYAEDNVGGLAREYGSALTSGLTVEDVQAWPDVLEAVTADDIMAAAAKVLDRRRAVTGFASPTPQAMDTAEVGQ